MKLSAAAEAITTSPILVIAAEINRRIAEGQRVYNLTVGDFDSSIFPIPEALTEGIIEAYRDHATNYPGAFGVDSLREAVAHLLKRTCGVEHALDEIQIASGSRPLIYSFYQTVVDPGDKVVFPVPSWNNEYYCQLRGAEPVPVDTRPENNFFPTAEDLRPVIGEASLLALCSPQNPTGTLMDRDQLLEICELVVEENRRRPADAKPLYVMFDQVYWLLTFGDHAFHHPLAVCPEIRPHAVFIDGVSKSFAGTGVRVGWGTGPAEVIARMRAFIAHVGAWAPKPEQIACGGFLADDAAVDGFLDRFRGELQARLEGFHAGILALREEGFDVDAIEPQAAIYLSVRLSLKGRSTPSGRELDSDEAVRAWLLDEVGIGVLPFSWFGADRHADWYRISVGTCQRQQVDEILQTLAEGLRSLR